LSLANIEDYESLLIIGFDKWNLEKSFREPFCWYSEPFNGTLCRAFIAINQVIDKNFPLPLLINLDDNIILSHSLFELKRKVFYSFEWNMRCSEVSTFVSDIIIFNNGNMDFVKKNYKLLSINS